MIEYVHQYDSGGSESDSKEGNLSKKARGEGRIWQYWQSFPVKSAAIAFISENKTWSKYYTKNTDIGQKVYFRCNKVKLRGQQCPAAIHLLYDSSTTFEIKLFKTPDEHEHVGRESSNNEVSEDTYYSIKKLSEEGYKPNSIMNLIQHSAFLYPPKGC